MLERIHPCRVNRQPFTNPERTELWERFKEFFAPIERELKRERAIRKAKGLPLRSKAELDIIHRTVKESWDFTDRPFKHLRDAITDNVTDLVTEDTPPLREDDVVLNDNYTSDQAVITPVIEESVGKALRAVYEAQPSSSRAEWDDNAGQLVNAEIFATYEVPTEGSAEQMVQEALSGSIAEDPVQIQVSLMTPEGESREVEVDVLHGNHSCKSIPKFKRSMLKKDHEHLWYVPNLSAKIPILPGSNLGQSRTGKRRITIRIPIEIEESASVPEGRIFRPKSILRRGSAYIGRVRDSWRRSAPKPSRRPPPRTSSCARFQPQSESQPQVKKWR